MEGVISFSTKDLVGRDLSQFLVKVHANDKLKHEYCITVGVDLDGELERAMTLISSESHRQCVSSWTKQV